MVLKMIQEKKNLPQCYFIIILVLSCVNFSGTKYCEKNTNVTFDYYKLSYDFDVLLEELSSKLYSYEIQSNTSRYYVKSIDDWALDDRPQVLEVTIDNLQKFFEKMKIFNIRTPNYSGDQNLSTDRLEKLNRILDFTLKPSIKINCIEDNILITGSFISLKNLQSQYEEYKNNKPLCGKKTVDEKQSIKIFASNTIFIDVDVDRYLFPSLTRMVPLVFIAPKWEIIGNRRINLNGTNGDDYVTSISGIDLRDYDASNGEEPRPLEKDRYGYIPGLQPLYYRYMAKGAPGLPGKPGGTFIGIGGKFVGAENLVVSTSGGIGGTGKNGENGRTLDRYIYKTITDCNDCLIGNMHSCFQVFENNIEVGGDGGKKGSGGPSGNITLIELSENHRSKIKKISEVGKDGLDGKGGRGGLRIDNLSVEYGKCYLDWDYQNIQHYQQNEINGPNGVDGGNEITEYVRSQLVFDHFNVSELTIIKEYRDFFRRSFQVSSSEFLDLDFIEKLNGNTVERSLLSANELYDELKELEMEYFRAENKDNLHPFYEQLVNLIYAYAKSEKIRADGAEYKLIKYLYTATLSRKNFLKENLKSGLITYVTEYLKNLQTELKENNLKFTKTKILENLKNRADDYKKKIENESDEAKNVTQTEVKRDLEMIGGAIKKHGYFADGDKRKGRASY